MDRHFFLLATLLTIAGCHNEAADRLQSGEVIGLFGLEGRWAGPVAPTTEGCGQTTTGLMTVGRKTFAFDPFQGTTVINGTVSDADLQGSLTRPGNGQQVVSISFKGTAVQHHGSGEAIEGRLGSGRCSWTVNLKRG